MKSKIALGKTIFERYRFLLSIVLLLICLAIALVETNRSFIFGLTVGIVVLVTLHFKTYVNVRIFTLTCSALVILLTALSIYIETDSSLGRLLIYKVSFHMFKDHWLFGVGSGNFQIEYGKYQAAYFASGNYSTKEFLLADNSYYAFNDYWQFVVENGILGGMMSLMMLYLIAKTAYAALLKQPSSDIIKLFIAILVSIAVAAFLTHVFEKAFFQLVVIITVLYLSLIAVKGNLSIKASLILISSTCILILGSHKLSYIINYKSYSRFKEAKKLISIGNISEGLLIYKSIFPILKNDIVFLENYTNELKITGNNVEALNLLIYTLQKRTSNTLYKDLGNLYFQNSQLTKAEMAYRMSVDMVPNRFVTRMELLEFYVNTHNIMKAKFEAQKILYMPIKINSNTIQNIKQKARLILSK